ncbi:hypothetical protein HMPREF0765_4574 [Sphingobacterium spiritivorum ATCC 33300]|uniref:Uncharacterized protein n=1 Tax=Sphingobacterium spiritivorum ATCC 33300 TaxID=525372 RepID=C2G4R8_SPHSI|nr:hypothetical protein HMPREF0765_4574 [Sphingobacterium spiritivorum ATCC 33300]
MLTLWVKKAQSDQKLLLFKKNYTHVFIEFTKIDKQRKQTFKNNYFYSININVNIKDNILLFQIWNNKIHRYVLFLI